MDARSKTESAALKKAFCRQALIGFPLGIAINSLLALFISLFYGDGQLHPVASPMLNWMPNELSAAALQFVLSGLLGSVFAGASPIFQIEKWSLARQTVIHFLVMSVTMTVVATLCGWTGPLESSLWPAIAFMLIFVLVYVIIWICICSYWRNWTKKTNRKLEERREAQNRPMTKK